MAVSERSRHQLYGKLEETIGAEAATTLIEHLPPTGWADVATKRDLDQLEQRVDARFNAVDERFNALDIRLDDRFALCEQRLLAAFRGELLTAVTAQTRSMIFTMAGTVVSLTALVFAANRFS